MSTPRKSSTPRTDRVHVKGLGKPLHVAFAAMLAHAEKLEKELGVLRQLRPPAPPPKPKDTRKYQMCGGCGATHPSQRCIGCFHTF